MKKLTVLLFGLLAVINLHAFTNIPTAINNYKAVIFDSGFDSQMTVWRDVFNARCQTDWTLQYSWTATPADTNHWGYSGPFSTNFVDRCIASNCCMVLLNRDYQSFGWYDHENEALRYAIAKGLLVFTRHFTDDYHWESNALAEIGPVAPILVTFGNPYTNDALSSFGKNLEFVDSSGVPGAAARFSWLIKQYLHQLNCFDLRAIARMTPATYPAWTNRVGYGHMEILNRCCDPAGLSNNVASSYYVQPPLSILGTATNGTAYFFWDNYLGGYFVDTIIKHGTDIVYQGRGSNILWTYYGYEQGYNTNGGTDLGYHQKTLNGVKLSLNYSGSQDFKFYTLFNFGQGGEYSQDTPYSKVTLIFPE